MKKIIAASVFALALLGSGAASADGIVVHIGGGHHYHHWRDHHYAGYHRAHCWWHYHHRVCRRW